MGTPPKLMERILRFKALQHKGGCFFIWGIPAVISQVYALVYLQKLMEDKIGQKKTMEIMYNMGKLQAQQGFKMISERFGYAKTMQDKKKLLDYNLGQTSMVGLGDSKLVRADYEKVHFIIQVDSIFAKEYKRFFGTQKNPIDHFIRGAAAAYVEEITEKKVLAVQTSCITQGKRVCEFVVKEEKAWKSDPKAKAQKVTKFKGMKELGSKIEPYLITNY